ncbi:type VII secretion-associated serine protease mycosin [Plantactinospora sp. GCM10030261]|uniref:type VII secretion-associated serine protease mycosin n=1 Tax=Plantactinospora sp. GCM10030261 TaxID=3273420 RepID=UPI00361D2DC7
MRERGRRLIAALCASALIVLPAAPARADRIRDDQWHLRYLRVAEAHRISTGAGVTVAVIDTGVDPHPDLRDNVLPGRETFPGGTGDGRQDADGHGTGMAGLIAAHGRGPGTGALGVAPGAKVLSLRYTEAAGEETTDSKAVATSINIAALRVTEVICMPFGGGSSVEEIRALDTAIKADAVVVAAAGNRPNSTSVGFPASYEGVVAVGASDRNGNRASISVTGPQLALVAPGVDIYSTSRDGRYRRGTGTSDATAIVAGAAALVRSRFPDLSAAEVVHRLTATATDRGLPGRDPEYGYGELNLLAALTADVPPLAPSGSADPTPDANSPTAGSPSVAAREPRRDTGERVLTGIVVSVAALLSVAVALVLFVPRLRRRSPDDDAR